MDHFSKYFRVYRHVCDRLHRAVRENRLERAQWILHGLCHEIDGCDQYGRSPLFIACAYDLIECAQWLVANGADVAFRDPNGWTLVHIASAKGSIRCLRWLVDDLHVDAHATTNTGLTCVSVAFDTKGRENCLPWLLQRFPETDLTDLATSGNFYQSAFAWGFLLERLGPDVRPDLLVLIKTSNVVILKVVLPWLRDRGLLGEYMSVKLRDSNVFEIINNYETHLEKVELLLQYGADPDMAEGMLLSMKTQFKPTYVEKFEHLIQRHKVWRRRRHLALYLFARTNARRVKRERCET